jgi:probable HAF family extracellular repeat protein
MRSIRVTSVIATTLYALAMPTLFAAQGQAEQDHPHRYHHYQLHDIRTFGGPNSSFLLPSPTSTVLSNSGIAVGGADTPIPEPTPPGDCLNLDCYLSRGFKWHDGVVTKLDALPGFNSSFVFAVSENGLAAGLSENGTDPLTGFVAWEAILWDQHGRLHDLGTLGGNESVANAVNSSGQVALTALNTIPDPYVPYFLMNGATQVHAGRWTNSEGLQDLGTLGGSDSGAFLINERGQMAGWSFTSTTVNPTTAIPTLDPFFWENRKMMDMGTLGGTVGEAFSLNSRGQVAGFSNLAGDTSCHPFLWDKTGGMKDLGTLGGDSGQAYFVNDVGEVVGAADLPGASGCDEIGVPEHAFLWKNGVMTDLGTPAGDPCSYAEAINSENQIVGAGSECNNDLVAGHAFLSEDGEPAVDLDTLIPQNLRVQLIIAVDVNDSGEIAALGALSNGDIHAFALIPCDENHPRIEGCDYSMVDAPAQVLASQLVARGTQWTRQSRRTNQYHFPGRTFGPGN